MSHNVGMNPTEQPSPSPLHSQVDDHDKSNTTPIPRDEHAKVVEAKAAVVLLKHSRIFTNNEYVQWRLKILFQPLHDKTYESMQFLYLSKNRKPIWKPDAHLGMNEYPILIVNYDYSTTRL
ncbi:predicted protein [Lichtheimia corymbifera JMRC:FSU:9682]|uniref:Uncharacterized protein n=1 Tax=Lichtheimia corymbifera JMRC:FSU:9682 TaxID=1263082 RepID=A0A068S3A7_9FUNG|nr:predicted protein [Lichtheimia corymbifera JMRC:FSU:9682]